MVKGFNNNLLRCIRSRIPPKAPASDPHNALFVPPPKTGYQCGRVFFDDKVLEDNIEVAKKERIKAKYPIQYSGHPYSEPCLIWPIFKDGALSRRGKPGPYRFVLTLNYKLLGVAIINKGKLTACDRKTKVSKKKQDKSDYICDERYYMYHQLEQAAEEARKMMDAQQKYFYPARYEGPGFDDDDDDDGPYFTYPVLPNGLFKQKAGYDRVVINTNCDVVGALTTLQSGFEKRLVKCYRLDDGPLPDNFFGKDNESVFEHRILY